MTVYGDGKQTRTFQYVSDLVDGLMRLMDSDHIGPFNHGNPGEFTMLELADVRSSSEHKQLGRLFENKGLIWRNVTPLEYDLQFKLVHGAEETSLST